MVRCFMLRTPRRMGGNWTLVGRRRGIPQAAVECPSYYLPAFGKAGGFLGFLSPPLIPARESCCLVEAGVADPRWLVVVHLGSPWFGLLPGEMVA